MEQLLSITRIPIKVEVKVHRGELRQVEDTAKTGTSGTSAPSVKVSALQDGGIRLQAEPYKIDLSEVRNYDSYTPSSSDNDITLTYEGIAKLADSAAKSSKNTGTKKVSSHIESVLQSLPKTKSSTVSYSNGILSINYQINAKSSENVSYDSDRPEFEFIPGSIEFIIEQMPRIDIEYLGDPIYFPRSADPNYEPPLDVFA